MRQHLLLTSSSCCRMHAGLVFKSSHCFLGSTLEAFPRCLRSVYSFNLIPQCSYKFITTFLFIFLIKAHPSLHGNNFVVANHRTMDFSYNGDDDIPGWNLYEPNIALVYSSYDLSRL